MNRKLLILFLAAIVVSVIIFAKRAPSQSNSSSVASPATQHTTPLPEHVPYMVLFNHHYSNLQKAAYNATPGAYAESSHLLPRSGACALHSQLSPTDVN